MVVKFLHSYSPFLYSVLPLPMGKVYSTKDFVNLSRNLYFRHTPCIFRASVNTSRYGEHHRFHRQYQTQSQRKPLSFGSFSLKRFVNFNIEIICCFACNLLLLHDTQKNSLILVLPFCHFHLKFRCNETSKIN